MKCILSVAIAIMIATQAIALEHGPWEDYQIENGYSLSEVNALAAKARVLLEEIATEKTRLKGGISVKLILKFQEGEAIINQMRDAARMPPCSLSKYDQNRFNRPAC